MNPELQPDLNFLKAMELNAQMDTVLETDPEEFDRLLNEYMKVMGL
jgi:hypothetical protein